MSLPEQLLLSDLLRLRVRCDQGLDRGVGVMGWMHPPVHRLLGWVSRPSAFAQRRLVWRLDQLRGLDASQAFVKGPPAEVDLDTLLRLPTLLDAALVDAGGERLGTLADAAVDLRTGSIRHYLVARSDPRLPGSSRWRLTPERILDQRGGRVQADLRGLDDLPLARASVRQEFLRQSRRWREQMGQESSRMRERFQDAGERFEERLEGWLEEPPWQESRAAGSSGFEPSADPSFDPLEDWNEEDWSDRGPSTPRQAPRRRRDPDDLAGPSGGDSDEDPWI